MTDRLREALAEALHVHEHGDFDEKGLDCGYSHLPDARDLLIYPAVQAALSEAAAQAEARVRELEEALRHLLGGGVVRMNGRDYALFGIEAYLSTGVLIPAPDGPLGRLAEAQAEVLDIDWDALRGEYAALTEAAATEGDTDD